MSATPAGISEADWQATPTAVRAFILDQQAELQAQQQEIEQLRGQLAALATELASLRESRSAAARVTRPNRPPAMGPGLSRRHGARAVAASAALSQVILDQGRSCCRSSGWMR
jgi:hypothetical protein